MICDVKYAKLVMKEAKRLNMLDGNFFWLWIDASRDYYVFHNISNRTYEEPSTYSDSENFDDEIIDIDSLERIKKDYVGNNNTVKETKIVKTLMQKISRETLTKDVMNSSRNSLIRRIIRNINKTETHIDSYKSLFVNFSQSYKRSSNISLESIRDYNVHNKGVETSKIANDIVDRTSNAFLDRNKSRQTSSSKLKNESFNKYVNSISVRDLYESNDVLKRTETSREDLINRLSFSSDISDFLMNPTVHTSTLSNIRNVAKKRNDPVVENQVMDEPMAQGTDDLSQILNKLPVGLLALHPEPMKIGKFLTNYPIMGFFIYKKICDQFLDLKVNGINVALVVTKFNLKKLYLYGLK